MDILDDDDESDTTLNFDYEINLINFVLSKSYVQRLL